MIRAPRCPRYVFNAAMYPARAAVTSPSSAASAFKKCFSAFRRLESCCLTAFYSGSAVWPQVENPGDGAPGRAALRCENDFLVSARAQIGTGGKGRTDFGQCRGNPPSRNLCRAKGVSQRTHEFCRQRFQTTWHSNSLANGARKLVRQTRLGEQQHSIRVYSVAAELKASCRNGNCCQSTTGRVESEEEP